ncbi:MAG: glyoxalase [Robiginitomaculum sp.]|nr:MAG: glyoxalase [Robiginitomaculum sp.]
MRLNQITLPATNIAISLQWYLDMDFELIVDSPDYKRLLAPDGYNTLSLSEVAKLGVGPAPRIYFEFESAATLDEHVRCLQSKGFLFAGAPQDQSFGWREAWISDPSGNQICLYHAGEMRLNPPWRVGYS